MYKEATPHETLRDVLPQSYRMRLLAPKIETAREEKEEKHATNKVERICKTVQKYKITILIQIF